MATNTLDAAREEFTKIIDEDEDAYNFVVEMSNPPEDFTPEEWKDTVPTLIDSTLDVLLEHEEPIEAVAIILDGDADAKVVRGVFSMGGEEHMYNIGEAGFNDSMELDALALSGVEDNDEEFAEYL